MVLVMGSDGSLSPSRAQSSFARTYNDGIGQGSAADGLHIFGGDGSSAEDEASRIMAVAPRAPAPGPDILAAIESTGLRYAGHPGLRTAGLTVTDWLNLFRANIEIESAYDPSAVSHAGAIALGVDPHDWRQNLDGSARYLALLLAEFGDVRLALAAYNAGPDALREHRGIPPYRETHSHIQRVLAVFNRLEGETS
ncbi:hypothetical protein KU6B_57600 (plasmid) [Mameliella alba]|uniref:lytic transglycosylase domain-containing protein n=1 Tax=Mameliella alba TaxID=561184 RepID=UPI0013E453E1|nr:lytic transglycosylase domain-containing protein [Mameliella alba]BBU59495.1 hypothetical protein KU6B_57600 [Mameliella alba]